jgi:colanic acid biosynthesis protein WcaH
MPSRLPYNEFIEIYSKVPRLCVEIVLIVLKTEDKILLTKRNIPPAKGMWHLPGGTMLKGETAEEAALRIALDELGINIEVEKFLGYCEFSEEVAVGQSISLVFLAIPLSNEIKLNEQASEYQYFKQLPEQAIEETKKFLEKNVLH